MLGGVAEAWVDSIPVLVISNQFLFTNLEKCKIFWNSGFNIIENVKNITKYSIQVKKPGEIKYVLEKAIHFAFEKRRTLFGLIFLLIYNLI